MLWNWKSNKITGNNNAVSKNAAYLAIYESIVYIENVILGVIYIYIRSVQLSDCWSPNCDIICCIKRNVEKRARKHRKYIRSNICSREQKDYYIYTE